MATPFRLIAVDAEETSLSGDKRPAGFVGDGPRIGAALVLDWYAAYQDEDGAPVLGGSATVQWYAVSFDGVSITTPTIGAAVTLDDLVIQTVRVPAMLWPWCRVTAMTPPDGATHLAIYTAGGAAGSNVGATDIAAEVTADVVASVPDGDEVETRVGAALTTADLPTQVALAVPDETQIQAAARAALSDAWGTVVIAYHQHSDIAASEIVAAPSPGFHLEILEVTINCTSVPLGSFAAFTLASDGEGLDIPRALNKGDTWSRKSVSPDRPLYTCATNVNFGIGAAENGTTLVCDVQYRVVAD